MDRDSGWVELLDVEGKQVLGRGRLVLTSVPSGDEDGADASAAPGVLTDRGQLDASDGAWEGRIDPLRLNSDAPSIQSGSQYRIRFEENEEILQVRLREWEATRNDESQALIESADGVVPAVVLELGGH